VTDVFQTFSHQPVGDTHDERRDKKTKPDNRNIFTPLALSPLPKQVVSKGNENQARAAITNFVGVNKKYFLPFSLKKVSKKLLTSQFPVCAYGIY